MTLRGILCVLALCWAAAVQAGPQECIDATCRVVNPGNGKGTGVVYAHVGGYVCVLTNAHVVESYSAVNCEFFRDGKMMQPLAARVCARRNNNEVDAAVLAIPASLFGTTPPQPIAIALPSRVVPVGEKIVTVGCPLGVSPKVMPGKVIGYHGTNLLFQPAPQNGRSGSAIFAADGSAIVGLLFGRATNDQYGYACSLQALWSNLAIAVRESDVTLVQCGPKGCAPSEVLPWRRGNKKQPEPETGAATPWPGFGQQPPAITPPAAAPPPQIDLTPLTGPLSEIAKNTAPAPAAGQDSAIPQLGAAVSQNAADIKALAEQAAGVQKRVVNIEDVVSARLKAKEVIDKVTGQGDGDPFLDSKFVRHAGAILGVLAVCVFGALLVMRTGRGLIGTVVHHVAERHPDNEFLQSRDEFWTGVGGKAQTAIGRTRLGKRLAEKTEVLPAVVAAADATTEPPAEAV